MLYHTGYWFREYTTEQFFSRYPAMGDHPLLLESVPAKIHHTRLDVCNNMKRNTIQCECE